jgi:beta-glucosidase-like glycosyl hydrolase
MARLDEAVGRVLRVKLRDGLFDKPAPAQRARLAGNGACWDRLNIARSLAKRWPNRWCC